MINTRNKKNKYEKDELIMYMIVEMEGNKITWNDSKISSSKEKAYMRIEFFKKQARNRNFQVIQMTKYKIAN